MNKQIGPKVKEVWNVAMYVLHNLLRFVIDTKAYHFGDTAFISFWVLKVLSTMTSLESFHQLWAVHVSSLFNHFLWKNYVAYLVLQQLR